MQLTVHASVFNISSQRPTAQITKLADVTSLRAEPTTSTRLRQRTIHESTVFVHTKHAYR